MPSQRSVVHNRHFLVCPVCLRTQGTLSVHLRRVCMKGATPKDTTVVVDKARENSREILKSGIVFSYSLIQEICSDADPLTRWIDELQRRHMVVSDVPDIGRPSTSTSPLPRVTETSERVQSDEDNRNEALQCGRDVQKNDRKKRLAEMGLDKHHFLGHPLLKSFANHLEIDKQNIHFKQEVKSVSRFMFYMNPVQPSLEFVRYKERATEFFHVLSEAKLGNYTQLNYIKSIRRFLQYHITNTNLILENKDLHEDCEQFIQFIESQKTHYYMLVNKESAQKRHDRLTQPLQCRPQDCWVVLQRAKKDFLAVLGKVRSKLSQSECTLVLYYLETMVILKHLQRPAVVEHMKVNEWLKRRRDGSSYCVLKIKYKTTCSHVAKFALSLEEERWFELYYCHVRPELLSTKKAKRTIEDVEGEECFFVSSSGKPVFNASNDLNRFHTKYRLKPITSQMARKAFKKASKSLGEVDKSLVADFLTCSSVTSENNSVVKAQSLICRLAGDSGGESEDNLGHAASSAASIPGFNPKMNAQVAYDAFLKEHPVSLDGAAPSKAVCGKSSPVFSRQLKERWLKAQMTLRIEHVLSYFGRRLPTESRVSAWIEGRGWKSNIPTAAHIIKEWKPSGSIDTALDSERIQRLTSSQRWRGLTVVDIQGKGKGVIATRDFQAGEVVCDYHGQVVTAKKGHKIHKSTGEGETGYMFFFKNSEGKSMCIDAHLTQCDCHPGKETFGRLVNHSRKHSNLRPRAYVVKSNGKVKDAILFIATKKIEVNDELLFDYGVERKSFRGEGLDLCWL